MWHKLCNDFSKVINLIKDEKYEKYSFSNCNFIYAILCNKFDGYSNSCLNGVTEAAGVINRSKLSKINELEIGKIQTIKVCVKKLSFPRIRNLPNKINCEDETGKLDCIFFNSYEGYIRKILPLNQKVTINGKVNFYNKRYQVVNPTNISSDENSIKKVQSTYSLTDGLNEKNIKKLFKTFLKNYQILMNGWVKMF